MESLLIVGAGGLGAEALWAAHERGLWQVEGFVDDNPALGPRYAGLPILGGVSHVLESRAAGRFHCAIGKNSTRKRIAEQFLERGWKLVTLVHPSVIQAPGVTIGDGTYVGPGSILCPNAVIGAGVIINCHVSLGHDSLTGDFSQLCPGSRISGGCRIGELAFIGSNASLVQGVRVGANTTVGTNSLVVGNVGDNCTVIGVPARRMR